MGDLFSFKGSPEDFVVEEILEIPKGRASHWLVKIEKIKTSTLDVIKDLAEHFSIPEKLIGYAGLKDSQAIAIQHLSIPIDMVPKKEDLLNLKSERFRVLDVSEMPCKLRAGHLLGNRFTITLREISNRQIVIERIKSISERGFPNFFDSQRFGHRGENLKKGLKILKGEKVKASPYLKRLYISAVSAWFFNIYLEERSKAGFFLKIMDGDLVIEEDNFWIPEKFAEHPERCIPTGPILGYKMPLPTGRSLEFEKALLAKHKMDLDSFRSLKSPGSRRPIRVIPQNLTFEEPKEGKTIKLTFTLPAGSYATVLLKYLSGEVTPQRGPKI